jgi:hypothetical protein
MWLIYVQYMVNGYINHNFSCSITSKFEHLKIVVNHVQIYG